MAVSRVLPKESPESLMFIDCDSAMSIRLRVRDCTTLAGSYTTGYGTTYIDNALNSAEKGSHRLPDEWNGVEEASLANQDVQKLLVDLDKLQTRLVCCD